MTDPPENATELVGATVTFSCLFLSDLHHHVDWYKGFISDNDTEISKEMVMTVKVALHVNALRFFLHDFVLFSAFNLWQVDTLFDEKLITLDCKSGKKLSILLSKLFFLCTVSSIFK